MAHRTALTMALGAFLIAGCGGGGGEAPPPPPPSGGGGGAAAPASRQAWSADKGTATVSGRVSFEGTAPKRRPIDMSREKVCHEHHGDNFLDESVIVGEGGGLQNVFVWVRKGLENWSFPAATDPVTVDQKNCVYQPHVFGVQVGQPVRMQNSDGFMHNVHGFPKRNEDFNFSQGGGAHKDVTFSRGEVPVPLKCDVHGWMGSFACVVEHPIFAVTGADGSFTLPKLPAGTYTVSAWHEVYGQKDQEITVADGAATTVTFAFSEDDE